MGGRKGPGNEEMSCAGSEDVTVRGDQQERGWPEPGWAKETVLPLGKANATLKETRKKTKQTNHHPASTLRLVLPKGALGRGRSMARISWVKSPGKGVEDWAH